MVSFMTEPSLPGLDEIVESYGRTTWGPIIESHYSFAERSGGLEHLVPLLVQAFRRIKSFRGRKVILHFILPYVRCMSDVLDLGIFALGDKSRIVREDALALIAYSLNDRAIPALMAHTNHADQEDRDSAKAAIDAIQNRNHHLFLDRNHAGNVVWGVKDRCGDV